MVSGISSMGVNPYASSSSAETESSADVSVMKKAMNSDAQQMQTLLSGLEASTQQPSQLAAQTTGVGQNLNVQA